MAKDPAFLFYSQDFYTGVATLSWEDRGKFISILCLMHQQGRMTEETIRFLVGSISDNLKAKFSIDEKGMWYNKRLEEESAKRNKFTESRRKNGLGGGRPKNNKPKAKPKNNLMVNLMENENENEDVIEINTKKSKLEIFQTLFSDDIFIEQLNRTHKGKDLKQAFEECYTHHSNAPNPPQELWEWKQKLNTWLTIKKPEHNGTSKKEQQNRSNISAFAARVIERNKGQ
jgi:hypothetical protein